MKIQKFNESIINDLDNFMYDILEYFYDDETDAMGPTFCFLNDRNKKEFYLEFNYLVMEMLDLENVLKVYNYCKSFDSNSIYYICAEKIDDEILSTCFRIILSIDKYDKISSDLNDKLKIKNDTNKYNL